MLFAGNFTAHRFYYNQGMAQRLSFKIINEEGLS
jgi:hypothetical protein